MSYVFFQFQLNQASNISIIPTPKILIQLWLRRRRTFQWLLQMFSSQFAFSRKYALHANIKSARLKCRIITQIIKDIFLINSTTHTRSIFIFALTASGSFFHKWSPVTRVKSYHKEYNSHLWQTGVFHLVQNRNTTIFVRSRYHFQ